MKVGEWPFRLRDRLSGLDEHDVGGAPQGLEFTVEGDTTDAIDAGDASAPNKAKNEFRAADEGEGLSDHNATSASVRQSHTASSMNVLSPDKRDRAAAACLHLPIFCFFTPIREQPHPSIDTPAGRGFPGGARKPTYRAMLWRTSSARSRRAPPAGFIRPCQPFLVVRPPADPDWLHEVKHDGYRIVARKQGESVSLWTRYGADFTDRLPRIAEAIGKLPADSALIDGEAVVFRPDGRSDFGALRTKAGGAQACLVAFDLLTLDAEDVRLRPIEERRDKLSGLVRGVDGVVFSEAIEAEGAVVFRPRLQAGPRRDCVEARRQPLSERGESQLAEVEEPGLREDVTHARDGAVVLSDLRNPTLSIVCEPCGRRGTYVANARNCAQANVCGSAQSGAHSARRAVRPKMASRPETHRQILKRNGRSLARHLSLNGPSAPRAHAPSLLAKQCVAQAQPLLRDGALAGPAHGHHCDRGVDYDFRVNDFAAVRD